MINRTRLPEWLDNPIFIKHLRSRLRITSLGAGLVVVLVFCLCIAWGGFELDALYNGGAFGVLLGLQAVILVVMGASQVGLSVGAARASAILDFHRVSPLSPTELTLGFFFGAPIREYLLFASTLPFSALSLAFGTPTVSHFVQWIVLLVVSAWVFHGVALLNALQAKTRSNPRGVIFLLVIVIFFGGNIMFVTLSHSGELVNPDQQLTFYGIALPWLAVVLLYLSAFLFFIYLAARRKMGAERTHPLSKPQSIAALVTLAVLLAGSIWKREEFGALEIATLYILVAAAIFLIMMVTPNRAEYDKGLWRASKLGRSHLPWWNDLSLNRVFLVVECAIVLVTATFASSGAAAIPTGGYVSSSVAGSLPLAIAVGVLVVAYFGLAHQYFSLQFGSRSKIYFTLFLFIAWLLPLVAGVITAMASLSPNSNAGSGSSILFSLSPVAGIGTSAAGGRAERNSMAMQAAAIMPALLFTFVFNGFLVSARRRAYRQFLASAAATGKSIPAALATSQGRGTVTPADRRPELDFG